MSVGWEYPVGRDPPQARHCPGCELLVVLQPELGGAVEQRDENGEHCEHGQRRRVQPRREQVHAVLGIHLHEIDAGGGEERGEPQTRGELHAHAWLAERGREAARLREPPGHAGEHERHADLHAGEEERVVVGVAVAHRPDVATDVEAVGEATAEELGTEREQRESDACEPSLPLPVVHPESVPAG